MSTVPLSQSVSRKALFALTLASLLASAGALAQEVWKWVDKNGVAHYSDTPVPGAVRIDVNVQTYSSEEAALPTNSSTTKTQRPGAAAASYELIEVWKPEDDSTISGSGGAVSVSVRVLPGVQAAHSLRLELDGVRVSESDSRATDFDLKEVARGTHTLSASIVARDGQTLIRSTPVTFHVLQPVIPSVAPPTAQPRPRPGR